jgi:hypothetical protein
MKPKWPSTMTKEEKYWLNIGRERGFDIAAQATVYKGDDEDSEPLIDTGEHLTSWKSGIEELYEIELHDRQFSPFEFTAQELNASEDADDLWDAFEQGIFEGILFELEQQLITVQ